MAQFISSGKDNGSATQVPVVDGGTGEYGRKLSGEAVPPPPSAQETERKDTDGSISAGNVIKTVVSKTLTVKKAIKIAGSHEVQPTKTHSNAPKNDNRVGDSKADIDVGGTALKSLLAISIDADSVEIGD